MSWRSIGNWIESPRRLIGEASSSPNPFRDDGTGFAGIEASFFAFQAKEQVMGLLIEADALVAKRLFFPVIVRICGLTRVSQYGFASYATVLSLLCIVPLVMIGRAHGDDLGEIVILGLVALMLAYHALRPELVRPSRGFWRALMWAMVALNLISCLRGEVGVTALLMWSFQLFAEYALLIGPIPPLRAKKRKRIAEAQDSN
jgi:hypothetical protein